MAPTFAAALGDAAGGNIPPSIGTVMWRSGGLAIIGPTRHRAAFTFSALASSAAAET